MEFFIQIKDGLPFGHPIFIDNFREAFPEIDIENLPAEFAQFIRKQPPTVGTFETVDGVIYGWRDGFVEDVYQIRQMNDEEKSIKIQQITENVLETIERRKQIAQAKIENSEGDLKQAWIECLAALNNWVLVDPLQPNFPSAPVVSSDGTILSITNSGTAPNVID